MAKVSDASAKEWKKIQDDIDDFMSGASALVSGNPKLRKSFENMNDEANRLQGKVKLWVRAQKLVNEGTFINEALINKLEKFAGQKVKPGRNTIKGFPVDISDDGEGSFISMDAVDADAAKGLVKALRAAKFKAKRDGNLGITISESSYMSWIEIIKEMTAHRRDAENQKAMKRIEDFWTRSKGDHAKFTKQINLRTKKMTKIEKIQIWASELENQNFHDEAEVAFKRLKDLGG